jgi:alpha-L-fucosidase
MKPLFRPEPGFATDLGRLAAEAGMRYAVMTAKHHDGFTLFRSQAPYSLDNPITGRHQHLARGTRRGARVRRGDAQTRAAARLLLFVARLAASARLRDGAARYPRQRRRAITNEYKQYLRAHVDELLTGYGELGTLWFDYSDAQRQGAAWGAEELLADLRRKQPHILVNNRLYEGLENKNGDYGTPEKYVPPTGLPGMDWEVNHTLNESYGYSAHDRAGRTRRPWCGCCATSSARVATCCSTSARCERSGAGPAQQVLRGVGPG